LLEKYVKSLLKKRQTMKVRLEKTIKVEEFPENDTEGKIIVEKRYKIDEIPKTLYDFEFCDIDDAMTDIKVENGFYLGEYTEEDLDWYLEDWVEWYSDEHSELPDDRYQIEKSMDRWFHAVEILKKWVREGWEICREFESTKEEEELFRRKCSVCGTTTFATTSEPICYSCFRKLKKKLEKKEGGDN